MGKPEEGETAGDGGDQSATGSAWRCGNSTFCKKSTCRWIVSVVISLHLLVFAVLSISFHGRSDKDPVRTPLYTQEACVQASFMLQRAMPAVNASLFQLVSDLQDEVGVPNTQVVVSSLQPLPSSNWTEVVFGVEPVPLNDSILPADLSVLKETFVELFLEYSVNLSLTPDLFGKVYNFEIIEFPGGITVVPEQPGFPLIKLVVLFNFTLHNNISYINCKFEQFRQQLADGISLKANESLFVQLTSLKGSTLKSPIVVQTSILPVVGRFLPLQRLKQLAQEITTPRRNLGLNHTLFGRVRGIKLSSYLQHSLKPAEGPSPVPSPSPSVSPAHPPYPHKAAPPQGSGRRGTPFSGYIPSAAPSYPVSHSPSSHHHHHHHHSIPAFSPFISPTVQPSPPISRAHPPIYHHVPSVRRLPPLHSSPSSSPPSLPSAAPSPGESVPAPRIEHPHSFPRPPSMAPSPQSGPAPSQIPELASSSILALPPTSSALALASLCGLWLLYFLWW